jgi:hypothetical protein
MINPTPGIFVHLQVSLRATLYMRLRARDQYSSSTLIGGKGGASPSTLIGGKGGASPSSSCTLRLGTNGVM